MNQTFSSQFQQEIVLEDTVAQKWGYKLDSTLYKSQVKQKKKQKGAVINESIKPLAIDKKKVLKSEKHISLLKQIQQLQHQKKMYDQSSENQKDIMGLMNERIKQYNYLIDYKHIKEKNSQDTKRVLKLKPKSEAQQILQKIGSKNNQLMKQQNLNGHFKLNKKITNLYRQYKNKMYDYEDSPRSSFNRTITTPIKEQPRKKKPKTLQNYGRKKSVKMRETHSLLNKVQDKNQNTRIEEVYGSKQLSTKGRELDKNISNNREILQLWKMKIGNSYSQNQAFSVQVSKQEIDYSEKQEPQVNSFRLLDNGTIQKLRKKKKLQEKYISSFLDRRNRKFKKPWGNKILIKYNSVNEAKQMLQGSRKQSPSKTGLSTPGQYSSRSKKFKSLYGKVSSPDIKEQNIQVLQSMKEQEGNNQKFYQIMCKNQKINLFLKDRKK